MSISIEYVSDMKKCDHCASASSAHRGRKPVWQGTLLLTYSDISSNRGSCLLFHLLPDGDLVLLFSLFVVSFPPDSGVYWSVFDSFGELGVVWRYFLHLEW